MLLTSIFLALLMLALALGFKLRAQEKPRFCTEDKFGDREELIAIDDPRVAAVVREHAARFSEPIRYVVIYGLDIVLLAENGDVVDICTLR